MAYTRTNWVEEETPLSAQNFNNIEDGIEELQSQKVDKVSGKGLSEQNYTAAEKTKLAGIETGATKNTDVATTSTAGLMSAEDKTKLDGVQEGAQANRIYNAVTGKPVGTQNPPFGSYFTVSQVSQNSTGQIQLVDRSLKIPDNDATTSFHGLMSTSDKIKLDKVSIRIVSAEAPSGGSIEYRSTKSITFKARDGSSFANAAIIIPLGMSAFPTGLAISSYDHDSSAFYLRLTNANPTTRTITAGRIIDLLVIDREV